MKIRESLVTREFQRLDQYLVSLGLEFSRAQFQRLIKGGWVLVNGAISKSSDGVRVGDHVHLTVPPPVPSDIIPQSIPIVVTFEDEEILVLDKPANLVVHPSPGHQTNTLVNGLLAMYPDLPGIGGQKRPGIVHRLDKDTSGLMMVAKTSQAHRNLSDQIKNREICKGYVALLKGQMSGVKGYIDGPIARDPRHRKRMAVVEGGRYAKTSYEVIERLEEHTLVKVYPETGRTHQIRVHFASVGHPLLGDSLYGNKSALLGHHFLHSYLLGFSHPVSQKRLEFKSSIPEQLVRVLGVLRRPPEKDVRCTQDLKCN